MSLVSKTGWLRRPLLAASVVVAALAIGGMTAPAKAQYYGYPYAGYAGYCNPWYYPYGCGYPNAYGYPYYGYGFAPVAFGLGFGFGHGFHHGGFHHGGFHHGGGGFHGGEFHGGGGHHR